MASWLPWSLHHRSGDGQADDCEHDDGGQDQRHYALARLTRGVSVQERPRREQHEQYQRRDRTDERRDEVQELVKEQEVPSWLDADRGDGWIGACIEEGGHEDREHAVEA